MVHDVATTHAMAITARLLPLNLDSLGSILSRQEIEGTRKDMEP